MGYGKGHQRSGGFKVAFAAINNACLTQSIALGINGSGATLRHLADVEQMFACLGVALDGGEQSGMGGGVAVSVAEEDGGIAVVGIKLGDGVIQHIAGGEEDGDDAGVRVELAF